MTLSPAQRRTLDALRRPAELPDFQDIGQLLEAQAVGELRTAVDFWLDHEPRSPLRITKWHMAGCERRRAWDTEQFAWSAAKAEGTILGLMVQLWMFEPQTVPAALFSLAVGQARAESSSLGRWFDQEISGADWADLALRCESAIVQWAEVFPPASDSFRPSVEATQQWTMGNGALVVTGRVDVQLGADEGTRAGVVFIETKKQLVTADTMAELRLYALLRALRLGTPPRAIAGMSISTGRLQVEEVTNLMLAATLDRLVAAVKAVVSLARGREPVPTPNVGCRWCEVQERCPEGQAWLKEGSR